MMLRRFAAVYLACAGLLFGQLDRGAVTGTVTDTSGGVIPAVRIEITNSATGAKYRGETNATGQYHVPNLPSGTYQLRFDARGFKSLLRGGTAVGVAETLRVDVRLEVGEVSESIEVTAEAPRLQTETPEVGTFLSNREIVNLPLTFGEARTAEDFVYRLAPGVSGNSWTSYVNGSPAFTKEVLLDGAPTSAKVSGTFVFSNPSVEALQEFKVQTGGLAAEHGRTYGGVYNFVMKSGTNQPHGSLYGALRNEALNANTFADNTRGSRRALDRKHGYAGSFGGPVYIPRLYDGHNRTFFYVAYERFQDRNLGFGAPNITVPLPEFYEGDFSRLLGPALPQTDALGRPVARGAIYDPATFRPTGSRWIGDMFPENRIPVSRFSRISRRVNEMAKAGYLPTVRDASGQIPLVNNAIFPRASQPRFDQYQFSVKGDQTVNDRHKLSGTYSFTARPRVLANQGGMWDVRDSNGGPLAKTGQQKMNAQLSRLAHDWTLSSRLLNHLTVFYNRQSETEGTIFRDTDGAKEFGIANLSTSGYPAVNWGGGPFVPLESPGRAYTMFKASIGWGVLDTVNFYKGRHVMKAGVDWRRNHLNTRPSLQAGFNFAARGTAIPAETFSGNLTGYSFASYLLGIVDTANRDDPVGMGGRRSYFAAFFQDDFKMSSRLTLQLGLRWEYQPPGTEAADRLSNWTTARIDPVSGLPGAYEFAGRCPGCTGSSYFGRRSLRDWGPRFGLAWQPGGRWTLRGAYGIFYASSLFPGDVVAPGGKAGSVAWGGTWQLSADPIQPWKGIFNWDDGFPLNRYTPPSFDVSWGNRNRPQMIHPEYGRTGYTQQWSFNLQRELHRAAVLDVGYLGNKATGLAANELDRPNQLPPSVLSQYGRNLNNPVRNAAEAATNGIRYPYAAFQGTVAGALRQYPQVQGVNTIGVFGAPLGFSHYHSLQVTLNLRPAKGLGAYANYVWSKTMANVESAGPGGNPGRPLDYYNLGLEKSVSPHDVPHMFKGYVDYALPVGRGQRLLPGTGKVANALAGGWSVSAIVNYFSGVPLGFGGSMPLSGGWNGSVNRAVIAPGQMKVSGFRKDRFELSSLGAPVNTYLQKSLFSDPPPLTLGTAAFRYAQARGFGTISEDLCIQKAHRVREKYRITLRADFQNALNRHNLGGVNTSVTSPLFGQVTNVFGNRVVQLGMRLDF